MSIPHIFDRRTYAHRRTHGAESFLAKEVGENLAERLSAVNRRFGAALDLSSRPEVFEVLAPLAGDWTRTSLGRGALIADEEALPFAAGAFDLVVSALSLHAVNDLPGALAQIRTVLKPDGLFLAALFGGATLADVRDLGGLLQRAGFALPVADSEKTIVRYRTFPTLIEDLRALGETNALSERRRNFLRRDVLAA